VRPEGLCQLKIAMTPSEIEPATFRFVARSLNYCATAYVPLKFITQREVAIYYRRFGTDKFPETSARNYHYWLRNNREERSSEYYSRSLLRTSRKYELLSNICTLDGCSEGAKRDYSSATLSGRMSLLRALYCELLLWMETSINLTFFGPYTVT
jgi:hypothetical protein